MRIVNRLDLAAPCLWAGFTNAHPLFVGVDGTLVAVDSTGQAHRHELHDGDVLVAAEPSEGGEVWTAGEDGRVLRIDADGGAQCMDEVPGTWISALAVHGATLFAYAHGRNVVVHQAGRQTLRLALERPVEALAFDPQGERLAMGSYDLIRVRTLAGGEVLDLEWKGVASKLEFSPDGRFLMASSRDAAFFGWRLDPLRRFRMLGYGRAVHDWSWSADRSWLVTEAATGGVAWHFDTADGPMGTTPVLLGNRADKEVVAVHCHPFQKWVALGYSDGLMVLESFDGDMRAVMGQTNDDGVACMRWSEDGRYLAFGTGSGGCGVVESSR